MWYLGLKNVWYYWEVTMPQAITCCIMTATHNAKSVNPNSMTHAHCWSVQALSPFYKTEKNKSKRKY